jgi:hypothetical protein
VVERLGNWGSYAPTQAVFNLLLRVSDGRGGQALQAL